MKILSPFATSRPQRISGIERKWPWALLILSSHVLLPATAQETLPSGREIVAQCSNKPAGNDQRSRLIASLTNPRGETLVYEFIRWWKAYHGRDGIAEKVVLFTLLPSESQGIHFLRVSYVAAQRPPDQWVYLPDMRITRRVAQRDPDNLDWGLHENDLRARDVDAEQHELLHITRANDQDYYVVKSTPKTPQGLIRVSWFHKTAQWADCVETRIDYFNRQQEAIKTVDITWRNIDGAWVWESALITNVPQRRTVMYAMTHVTINTGLQDEHFNPRALANGPGKRTAN